MYTVRAINKIAQAGLSQLPAEHFRMDENAPNPDAVLVRSAKLHDMPLEDKLLCIARAGAGVNNIPVDACTKRGIVVFNTPGANANAVKELVICSLFLASRNIIGGIEWCRDLIGDVPGQVEKGKASFVGPEISGKTLGIIGIGAIGANVANAAHYLGMDVLGFDPYISVDTAWGLSRSVRRAGDLEQILSESDYITLNLPSTTETKKSLSDMLLRVKPGVRIINMARADLINDDDMLAALDSGKVARYVTDFPTGKLISCENVVPIPHLGASTPESEENCSVMACKELTEYVLLGNIVNSVNYPSVVMPHTHACRLCVFHENIPNMLSDISSVVSGSGLNIENMLSRSKGDMAYTILDCAELPDSDVLECIRTRQGIVRVRMLKV
ncbi:MAG: phosphoglycerate dehydrogenase [Oscillospiraceae bacterium]|nr:phosphoglycerate dehydrogenase [Oscillospiraceae bacterium]